MQPFFQITSTAFLSRVADFLITQDEEVSSEDLVSGKPQLFDADVDKTLLPDATKHCPP